VAPLTAYPDAGIVRLAAAGVRAAVRVGRARLSFYLYTSEADVDRAPEALSS
jgi:selenocysteine lyase/cysteine desulfurase